MKEQILQDISDTQIFDLLDKEKIDQICFRAVFAGSGDEGYIEDVYLMPQNSITSELEQKESFRGVLKECFSVLEESSLDLLEEHHPGWEINSGMHGAIMYTFVEKNGKWKLSILMSRYEIVEQLHEDEI